MYPGIQYNTTPASLNHIPILSAHTAKEQQLSGKQPLSDTHTHTHSAEAGGGACTGNNPRRFCPLLFSCSHPRRHTQRQIYTLLFSYATQGETSA